MVHALARQHRTALERISARNYVEVPQRLHVDVALSARLFLFYITQIMRYLNGRVASATARPAMPLAMSLSLVSVVSNALRLRRLRIYPPVRSGRSDSLFQGPHAHAVTERRWWINDHSVVVLKPVEYLGFFRVALSDLDDSLDSFSILDDERAPVVGTAE